MNRYLMALIMAGMLLACQPDTSTGTTISAGDARENTEAAESPTPDSIFGYPVDSFLVTRATLGHNDFLSTILQGHRVDYQTIHNISQASRDVYDVRNFQAGKSYCVLSDKDSVAKCFVYQPNALEYIVYDFSHPDSVVIFRDQKPVTLRERAIAGEITSSLYASIQEAGANPVLALKMSEVYAWSIDFYRIQKFDRFKVIYDEKIVDGKVVGLGKIKAAWFKHFEDDYYAFWFEQGQQADYFDEEANSLRKAFLKAPVKFSTITSRYTMNRYHPVLKRNKPHLGTDYAAPRGTPIVTTGDGVVIAAGYTGGNGNYVKVRHNSTYTTQYLHMSRFAKGIRKGVHVKQGDVIGYVGATGLATGPHVCYRFWKHGRQVDPFKEKIPPSEPVTPENRPAFDSVKTKWMQKLEQIPLPRASNRVTS